MPSLVGRVSRGPGLPVFVAWASLSFMVLSTVAFWPAYLSRPARTVDLYTHAHAALGAAWLIVLFAQSRLAQARRHAAHRIVGWSSVTMVVLFVGSSLFLAHYRFSRMDPATFEREAYTLYLPLSAALLVAASYALALAHRRVIALHARFMACTAVPLVDPVLGRVLSAYVVDLPQLWHYQLITYGVESAALLMMYTSLATSRADKLRFGTFAAAFITVLILWFVVPHTAAWHRWADSFRGWPIT